MATASLVSYKFVGLRDMIGRFASMHDVELRAICEKEAEDVAAELQDLYRAAAPKSGYFPDPPRASAFADSITAEIGQVPDGWELRVQTTQPDIRDYIKYGHRELGPDDLITAKAYHFWIDGEEIYAKHISAVAPNDWEGRTEEAVFPVIERMGNQICVMVTEGLDHGVVL